MTNFNPDELFSKMKTNLFFMVGPNVIESEKHIFYMATEIKKIMEKHNVMFFFKSSFDKANRSSISSYRGLGFEKGLEILKKVKEELQIPIITDIHESWQAGPVSKVADIIQIPAFLCRQTDLLKAAAETGKIIQIKKAQFASSDVMHQSKKKIIAFGNEKVILCERGNMYGYQDLFVDFRNIKWLKKDNNLVSMDITHCLQAPAQKQADGSIRAGGYRELIPLMGKLAVVSKVDGIFMETHDRPNESKCDAPTQFPLTKLDHFVGELLKLDNFVKNNINL